MITAQRAKLCHLPTIVKRTLPYTITLSGNENRSEEVLGNFDVQGRANSALQCGFKKDRYSRLVKPTLSFFPIGLLLRLDSQIILHVYIIQIRGK